MGYFSTYYGSKHALEANDRSRAAAEAAAEAAAASDEAYKEFLVKNSLLGHSEVIANITTAGSAQWEMVLDQLTAERNGYVYRRKCLIGLCTFLACGVVSGIMFSWNWVGILFIGGFFGIVFTFFLGYLVKDQPAREEGVRKINALFASGGIDIEHHMSTLVQDQANVAEQLRREMLGLAD